MSELKYSESKRDRVERTPLYRELHERRAGEMVARLLWLKKTNTVWIHLTDPEGPVDTTFQVPNEEALEAFYHPYAYLPVSKELAIYGGEDGA